MSEFHYVRTLGVDGGVDAVEGPAVGLDLETILKDGLPPFKVVLEIIASLCEILDIADQDGEPHGDIQPRYVFLDETGAVSLEGFGGKRSKTMAPERVPKGTATDQWGLGYVGYRLFAANDLANPLPDDADGYDDAIIDSIVGINFEELPEEIVGDIQWYFAKLMSFEREDRPTPVETWRTFIAFSDTVPGPRLDDWANAALGGGGERRDKQKAAQKPAPPPLTSPATEEEDLGGPVMAKGPLSKGAMNFEAPGGGKKGQATAFWSRDQMKAALDAEDDEEEGYKPAAGGGSATNFWTRDQMKAMSEGSAEAPRPKRKAGGRAATQFMERVPKKGDPDDDLDLSGRGGGGKPVQATNSKGSFVPPPPKGSAPAAPPPKQNGPGLVPPPPVASAGAQNPPGGYGGQIGAGPAYVAPEEAPKSNMGMIIGIVVALVVVGLIGFALLGGGGALAWFYSGTAATTPAVVEPTEEEKAAEEAARKKEAEDQKAAREEKLAAEKEKRAAEAKAAEGEDGKKPTGKDTKTTGKDTKTSTTTTPKTTTTTPPKTTTTTPPKTTTTTPPKTTGSSTRPKETVAEPAATGPVKVKVTVSARAKLRCGDGQSPVVDPSATLEFDPATLPISCFVDIGGVKGVFQASKAGSISCSVSGSDVVCN